PLPPPHVEQLSMAASEPHSAPSPLEGEGWGGGWLFDSAELVPPSRLARFARETTSPSRGEVTRASDPPNDFKEPEAILPPMPLGEEVVNDYRFLKFSLRAHPASFLRADLSDRGIIPNEELRKSASGTWVSVSGLVTVRQRPGSANGVIFLSIEDETALANI